MKAMKANIKLGAIVAVVTITVLIAILAAIYFCSDGSKEYAMTIKEIGSDSMLVFSSSEELGRGEILLTYDEDMVIRDVNGQELSLDELAPSDNILIKIRPNEKNSKNSNRLDPVVETMILIPDDSNDFI